MKPQQTRVAAYAMIFEGESMLLCRLSSLIVPWAGHWSLPGGGVEFGESPEQAMVREVEEETGLRVEAQGIAGMDSTVDRSGSADRHHIRIIYHARVTGGTLRNELTGSTDLCGWHPVSALAELNLVDLVKAALRLAPRAINR